MYLVEYAPLNYYNNVVSKECLCLGVLFHNLTTGKRNFTFIKNFERFKSFDDEADPNFVKIYLKGIKKQVENNLFNYDKTFSISNYTHIFVNEFRFSKPIRQEFSEKEDYVDILTKMFLKYDFEKKHRLSKDEEKKYIKEIFNASGLKMSNPKITGDFNEKVNFDYVINNFAIKVFSFKDKNPANLIASAKQWAFSANELKKKYTVIFLFDEYYNDNAGVKIIMDILKSNNSAKVYQFSDGISYITKEAA